MEKYITLYCLKLKCPNIRKVPRDKTDPPKAKYISMYCPWHLENGNKEEITLYFDKNWKPIDYDEIDKYAFK